MRVPTIFANVGGPGKTLNGWAILGLHRKELQVLVWLTCTAKVATFRSRLRKEKETGLVLGLEGRYGHCGYSHVVTHNCRMQHHIPHATKDTPGQGCSASTAMSGFGILKG